MSKLTLRLLKTEAEAFADTESCSPNLLARTSPHAKRSTAWAIPSWCSSTRRQTILRTQLAD